MRAGQFPLILVVLQFMANPLGFTALSHNYRALYKKFNLHQENRQTRKINKMHKLAALNINQTQGWQGND